MNNYEFLLRGLLDLPNKPAVINLQYVLVPIMPPSRKTLGPPPRFMPPLLSLGIAPLALRSTMKSRLTPSIFALMFRQLALGGDMVCPQSLFQPQILS